MSVSTEYIDRMMNALPKFLDNIASLSRKYGSQPITGSKAFAEQGSHSHPEYLASAWGIGNVLIEHAGEHVSAFVKTQVQEPIEVIASWTCVRSMLEACAICIWLLDPTINSHERIKRSFAHRYEGMDQQKKYGKSIKISSGELAKLEKRIDDLEQIALELGYSPVEGTKGRLKGQRIGIGQVMLNATELIGMTLGEEQMYRLLSAVAHGHHWAILRLCYENKDADPTVDINGIPSIALRKKYYLNGTALLGLIAFRSFAKSLWNQAQYFGWPLLEFEEQLEITADALDMTVKTRFWRT